MWRWKCDGVGCTTLIRISIVPILFPSEFSTRLGCTSVKAPETSALPGIRIASLDLRPS